jgi:replicative DNA helicase
MFETNSKNTEKIPPHNNEAEESILGAILIDKNSLLKISDILTPEDFYKSSHSIIYKVMVELYSNNEPIDILSVGNRLQELNKLERIGGRSFLINLANSVPTASHIKSYANIVQKKSLLRNLISAAGNIAQEAFNEETDADIILDNSEQALFQISQKHLKKNFIPIKNVLFEAFDRIDELHKEKGKLKGIPTGFHSLDNLLGGLQKANLIIIAARPSVGKTSLALDIARHVGVKEKKGVALFSLEMAKEELVDRFLAAQANVGLWNLRTGKVAENEYSDDFARLNDAMGELSESKIFIDDSSSSTILEIRTKARRLQMEENIGLIIIDYLQLMEGRKKVESRVQEVSEISRKLKNVAKELNIPIIALSQLSRSVEQRNPPIPKLSDLRESGSIEQDADVVIFIYRESKNETAK